MKTVLIITILAAALLFGHHAHSRSVFPSISQLEIALNLIPGQPLPKLVVVDGRVFQPKYVRAEVRNNGEYAVIVKLDQQQH